MASYTLAERNAIRNFVNGRIDDIKVLDETGAQRYLAGIQTKTLYDGRIEIVQSLLAATGNGYRLTRVQIINADLSVALDVTLSPALDKRDGQPEYNLPVNIVVTMGY